MIRLLLSTIIIYPSMTPTHISAKISLKAILKNKKSIRDRIKIYLTKKFRFNNHKHEIYFILMA